MNKGLIYLMLSIGGVLGSYLPVLFGADSFLLINILGGAIGGFVGIWIAVKLSGA